MEGATASLRRRGREAVLCRRTLLLRRRATAGLGGKSAERVEGAGKKGQGLNMFRRTLFCGVAEIDLSAFQSVQRFVRKLKGTQPQRVWRMEAQPGEEVQVDFGLGAPIWEGSGRPRRSRVFRMVLSYSRKAYGEGGLATRAKPTAKAVLRQDTETFLRCLENGLRAFGGVPLLMNLDNLKAAVLKADWFDPEINPKLADFCRHYGLHVVPCPWETRA